MADAVDRVPVTDADQDPDGDAIRRGLEVELDACDVVLDDDSLVEDDDLPEPT